MHLLPGRYIAILMLLLSENKTEGRFIDDICSKLNGQRIYLEHGENGTLMALKENNILVNIEYKNHFKKRCTIEFVSCPSCIVKINFRLLNLPRHCEKSTIFENCGCDYVWIYEPTFEESSQQFCGRFIENNITILQYTSQTRKLVVSFLFNQNYQHAFTLDYFSERNKLFLKGYPTYDNVNNKSQIISSPYFPNLYPSDLTMEHVINCESPNETCRIRLIFTDFLIGSSSIMDFFDWNGDRIFVTSGNLFRPPVIVSSGPTLYVKFYANGASNFGFKAHFSFTLNQVNDSQLKPDIDCGGYVNNLGGRITMMNMVEEGVKFYDCVWLIRPPETYLHIKKYLYIKLLTLTEFGPSSELTVRQGLTSAGPIVENLKLSLVKFHHSKEHIVPISLGFYVSLKALIQPKSRLALAYAAFNNKNCLARSNFLCHNMRCISALLNCDGFDHCGDNSDESTIACSKNSQDRRQWSKTPNFLFTKVESLTEFGTSTLIFFLCGFGLIGLIFATIFLLYRINLKSRHQRQIQDHIETIHAILEEGVRGEVERVVITPDDPPDYEAPPDYDEVIKTCKVEEAVNKCNKNSIQDENNIQGTSTMAVRVPDSPPPVYQIQKYMQRFQISPTKNDTFDRFISNAKRLIYVSGSISKCFSDSALSRTSEEYLGLSFGDLLNYDLRMKRSFTTEDINVI